MKETRNQRGRRKVVAMLATALGVLSWGDRAMSQVMTAAPQPPHEALAVLSGRRVYFGHQSVGSNLLDGVVGLSAQAGGPVPRVVETDKASSLVPGVWAHGPIGRNGDPSLKISDFESKIRAGLGGRADLAFMKLCYADLGLDSNVVRLFATYRDTLARLARDFPSTRFVHFTVPLTTVQTGPKAMAKRLLGRLPGGAEENAVRERFNALMRQAYEGQASLFDLARLEATRPDGGQEQFSGPTGPILALAPTYAADPGHLNSLGQRTLASELLRFLAAQPLPAGARQTGSR